MNMQCRSLLVNVLTPSQYRTSDGAVRLHNSASYRWLLMYRFQLIYLNYTGIVEITPAVGAILGGSSEAKTTPYGTTCSSLYALQYSRDVGLIVFTVTHLTFETGSEKYKELETSVFVSTGHFIVEKDKPVVVEYKVSRVKHPSS